jgi:uncharacterized protein YjiS (DUF1127 family)
MALANNARPAPFGAIATFNLVNRFETAFKTISDWNAKRKTQNILSQLSDRELADIGLIRGDLDNLPSRF